MLGNLLSSSFNCNFLCKNNQTSTGSLNKENNKIKSTFLLDRLELRLPPCLILVGFLGSFDSSQRDKKE